MEERTPSGPLRVVLVDDHDALRRLTRMWIEGDARFTIVGEASDGLGAIDEVTRTVPDVVILDVAMPGMDGIAALPFLRRAAPDAVLVAYTNHVGIGSKALERGADACFEKTLAVPDLLDRVHQLWAGRVAPA